MKRYVLTGGPCSGKTTVIRLLAECGHAILPELAREMIEKEVAKGGNLVPWIHPQKFEEAIARRQFWRELRVKRTEVLFLDRGLIDTAAYCAMEGVKIPKITSRFGKNRYDKIFLLDLVPFHKQDDSRKENREFAEKVHKEIRKAYVAFGYDVIIVPMMTAEERVEFILNSL
jgi:predicted ATPase